MHDQKPRPRWLEVFRGGELVFAGWTRGVSALQIFDEAGRCYSYCGSRASTIGAMVDRYCG